MPVSAEKIVSRLETPGLSPRSKRISEPESVTAERIFFAETLGSSSSSMIPAGEEADFLIFAVGSCRSSDLRGLLEDVRLGQPEGLAVAVVEPLREVAGQLEVLALVLADRHVCGRYSRMSAACRTG